MMTDANRRKSVMLRNLAFELETLADQVAEPSRCTGRSDQLIAEGERIAAATRAVFRG